MCFYTSLNLSFIWGYLFFYCYFEFLLRLNLFIEGGSSCSLKSNSFTFVDVFSWDFGSLSPSRTFTSEVSLQHGIVCCYVDAFIHSAFSVFKALILFSWRKGSNKDADDSITPFSIDNFIFLSYNWFWFSSSKRPCWPFQCDLPGHITSAQACKPAPAKVLWKKYTSFILSFPGHQFPMILSIPH